LLSLTFVEFGRYQVQGAHPGADTAIPQ
jgi:hypothetical protein